MTGHTPPPANHAFEADAYAAAYPETRPFWEAAQDGHLLLKHCNSCRRFHWYPRVVCPLCGSGEVAWERASGRASLHAFTEVLRTDVPYVLAYVQLAEGPMVLTNIVTDDTASLVIGQPMQLCMRTLPSGRSMPFFEPVVALPATAPVR